MSAKSLVCPNCNARIDDFDRSTGIGTCAYCGAIVSDPDFIVRPTSASPGQPGPAPVVINVTAASVESMPQAPAVSGRSQHVALILCYVLGMFGAHRFYAGKVGTGFIWMFTCGCFLVGWVVDAVTIASDRFVDAVGLPLVDDADGPRPWWNRAWGAVLIVIAIILVLYVAGSIGNR